MAANLTTQATVALCMIVRDEAEYLPRCLASVEGLVDEVVVVDTGSSDGTPEIARAFGAKVSSYRWKDDFAAARNVSIERATADWILWLDADETLERSSASKLRLLTAERPDRPRAIVIPIRNYLDDSRNGRVVQHYAARLFVHDPNVRFHRPVHEDLVSLDPQQPLERVVCNDLVIEHFGYNTNVISDRQKEQRNLRLLEALTATEGHDPYNSYLLGREYFAFGRHLDAIAALEQMLDRLDGVEPLYAGEAYAILVAALTASSQLESAIEVAERGLEAHNFTDLWFNLGVAQLRRKDPASAAQAFYRALALRDDNQPYSRDLSISAWRAWLCLGAALQQVGDLEGARFAITEAHRAAPLERDVVIAAGAIAAMSGRPGDAVKIVEAYLERQPEDAQARQLLADARRELSLLVPSGTAGQRGQEGQL